MANHLKMVLVHSILTLATQGWSQRRIARELGVDRETVSRHIRLTASRANPAKAPIGSVAAPEDSRPANAPLWSPVGRATVSSGGSGSWPSRIKGFRPCHQGLPRAFGREIASNLDRVVRRTSLLKGT